MEKFVEFVKNLHCNQYDKFITSMLEKQVPIAVFSSFTSKDITKNGYDLLESLFEAGFNVNMFLTPGDPNLENFSQYPNLKVENITKFLENPKGLKYVFVHIDLMANGFLEQFAEQGITLVNYITQVEHFNRCYDFYMQNLPRIFEAYKSLDEKSREVFLGFILGNVSSKLNDYVYDPMPQYFLDGFMPRAGDILIDGGAFDGSSGATFKKYGCEVYAFELDATNFSTAYERGKSEGFTVENFGLGEYSHEMKYLSESYGSSINNNGSLTAQIISLDEYVVEKNLPRIDFIKLDVEGSEMDTLKGAALSIARWKPRLAISAYHHLPDVYIIYEFLKKIRPDYEFAFRHYRTSYDNESDLFEERGKEFLETFNLPLKIPYVWEALLYAR